MHDAALHSLKGVKRVGVVVFTNPEALSRTGLTSDDLAAKVGQQLSREGIRILSESDLEREPGHPAIVVEFIEFHETLETEGPQTLSGMIAIGLQFRQDATLEREPGLSIWARTWTRSDAVITYTLPRTQEQLASTALRQLDRGLSDFITIHKEAQERIDSR